MKNVLVLVTFLSMFFLFSCIEEEIQVFIPPHVTDTTHVQFIDSVQVLINTEDPAEMETSPQYQIIVEEESAELYVYWETNTVGEYLVKLVYGVYFISQKTEDRLIIVDEIEDGKNSGWERFYINNLEPGTIYSAYPVFKKRDSGKTVMGNVVSFKTLPNEPQAETKEAENIEESSAILQGLIRSGGEAIVWFEYWEQGESEKTKTIPFVYRGYGWVSTPIYDLEDDTVYNFMVFATNEAGTVSGGILTFQTEE